MSDPRDTTRLADQPIAQVARMPIAGILAWLIPGLGHIFIGERVRGIILLITITVTFWTGVAIGGVQDTVAPHSRKLWFLAQICNGGNTLTAYGLHWHFDAESAENSEMAGIAHWASADVGVHYTGVAGLLNLLVIFDALSRAERLPNNNHSHRRRKRGEAQP